MSGDHLQTKIIQFKENKVEKRYDVHKVGGKQNHQFEFAYEDDVN